MFDDDLVNEDEADSVTLSGQVEVGSTVNSITITDKDGTEHEVTSGITVNAETGVVSVTGQDLSELADGTLTVTMNVTDKAGNTGDVTDTTILDTTDPEQNDGLNSIVFDDDLVNEDEADSVTLSGQVEVGSTVNSITITDKDGTEHEVTSGITVNAETGVVSVTGQDLSELADGTLTVTMNVTDKAGNTGDVTDTTILDIDLSTPTIDLLASSDSGDSDTDNLTNDKTPTFSLGNIDDDVVAAGIVVLKDGVALEGTLTEEQDGTWSFTPSADLADGTYDLSVKVTDDAGNSATSTELEVIIDTEAAASITIDPITADNTVNADEADGKVVITGTVGGDVKAGETVTLTVNGETYRGDVFANDEGDLVYSIEVDGSDLVDDEDTRVEASVTTSDYAGNEATAGATDGDYDVSPIAVDDRYNHTHGLSGAYYGHNSQVSSVATAFSVINASDPDVTFSATDLDYSLSVKSGVDDDAQLSDFLGDDADSISGNVPNGTTDGVFNLTGAIYLDEGEFALKVNADDGYSIKIDGVVVAEVDSNQSPTERIHNVFEITDAGYHTIEIVYWDQGGDAVLDVDIGQYDSDGDLIGDFSPLLDAPTLNDELCTVEGLLTTISAASLLANDSDPDGDSLTIQSVTSVSGGTVALNENGDIQFIPDDGFSGDATFTYTLVDSVGLTDTATVTVHVEPKSSGLSVDAELSFGTNINPAEMIINDAAAQFETGTVIEGSGNSSDNLLVSTNGAWVEGYGGNDIIVDGGVSNDFQASGGQGNDILIGGNSDDLTNVSLNAGAGSDVLVSQSATATTAYYGGSGSDMAYIPASLSQLEFIPGGDNDLAPQADFSYKYIDTENDNAVTYHDFYDIETLVLQDGTYSVNDDVVTKVTDFFNLNIDVSLKDSDGSEIITDIVINGVPDGATLNVGSQNQDGSWSVPSDELDASGNISVVVEAPVGSNPVLTVTAGAQEVDEQGEPVDLPKYAQDETGSIATPDTDPNGDNIVSGGSGDDVVLGDSGGTIKTVVPGLDYNIALIVDTSGSMAAQTADGTTRIEMVEAALKKLVESFANHDGTINVKLIAFDTNVDFNFEAQNITENAEQYEDLLNKIDTELVNALGGVTDYEKGLNVADSWFNGKTSDGSENLAFFLTDGKPYVSNNSEENDVALKRALDTFESLSEKAQVQAIGIGDDISADILQFFDNTTAGELTPVPGLYDKEVLFDFNGSLSGTDSGSDNSHRFGVSIESNQLQVKDQDNGWDTVEAEWTSNSFTVENSAQVDFDLAFDDGEISWGIYDQNGQLVDFGSEYDASNNGYYDQNNAAQRSITSEVLDAGTYTIKIGFDANRNSTGRVKIDQINLLTPTLAVAGVVQNVTSAEQLEAALQGGSIIYDIANMGNDEVTGNEGNDILFGDAINTDNLPWSENGLIRPDSLPDGSGIDALTSFLTEMSNGIEPSELEVYEYIRDNHEIFNVDGDTRGGDDTIEGGEGDDILYGQGGDDTLIGGLGNDILVGGEGDDIFKWVDEPLDDYRDVITDFEVGSDLIDLSELLHDENTMDDVLEHLSAKISDNNQDLELTITNDQGSQTIVLQGQASNLSGFDVDSSGVYSGDELTNLVNSLMTNLPNS
ncbi:Ig-like domain-containing protein [Vibrio celticus]|uniref:Ig-like domain-containing protein n=4 Tax=Vibrio TaxID=662 RepID=UPI0021C4ADFA|nr:Ig-like domain-containing protein [Vibrio celticus]